MTKIIHNIKLHKIARSLQELKVKYKKNSCSVIQPEEPKEATVDKDAFNLPVSSENTPATPTEETWKVLEKELSEVDEEIDNLRSKYIAKWGDWGQEQIARKKAEQTRDSLLKLTTNDEAKLLQLSEQGYSGQSREEIRRWNLLSEPNALLPNLNQPTREGVVKVLSTSDTQAYCEELVVLFHSFAVEPPERELITENNLAELNSHLQVEYSLGISQEIKESNNRIIKATIKDCLSNWKERESESEWVWDIYVLVNRTGSDFSRWHSSGISADSAFYTALISAYLKIPLPSQLAIMGSFELSQLEIEEEWESQFGVKEEDKIELRKLIAELKETPISQWKITAVGDIETKVKAAIASGVKIILLPAENSAEYNRLSPLLKKQIKEVIFVRTASDLIKFVKEQTSVSTNIEAVNEPLNSWRVEPISSFLGVAVLAVAMIILKLMWLNGTSNYFPAY